MATIMGREIDKSQIVVYDYKEYTDKVVGKAMKLVKKRLRKALWKKRK